MLVSAVSKRTRERKIVAAMASGAASRVLSALLMLVSLPLAVRYLGPERFGLWATIASTVVFLNLLDLGIASTLTNHIARAYAVGDRDYAARYTANALAVTVSVACAAGLALIAAWPYINWMALFNVSASVTRRDVSGTVAVAAILMLLGLPASLGSKILAGYQQVHLGNAIVAAGTVVNLVGLATGIALRVSMPVLFLMSVGSVTVCNLAALVATLLWFKPWLRLRASLLQWRQARELLGSGSGFLLIQIAGAVVFSSDNVVVSHYLGAAQVTPYNVTWRFVGLAAVLQSLIFPALWPAYAEANARGDYDWIRRTFRFTMQATLALNLAGGVIFVAAGKPLIRWWAGEAAMPSMALLVAMALWAIISGCMTVESCLLAAVNRTREQGVLSIVAAAVNLLLSIALVQRVGAIGVITGTIVSYLLVLVVPQSLIVSSVLRASQDEAQMGELPAPRGLKPARQTKDKRLIGTTEVVP
ncbi:MAG: lipopolysaccharide biosynthesis protein [Candidatus Korobacteraceae bacterium]